MECPECEGNSKVIDSRKYAGTVYRKRECKTCRFRFWTEETEIENDSRIIRDMLSYYKMVYRDNKRKTG